MITFIIGASIILLFCVLFYLEDRAGVGIYDPDPRPRKRKQDTFQTGTHIPSGHSKRLIITERNQTNPTNG